MAKSLTNENGRSRVATPRGRPFVRGNPGRRSGSKNKNTLLAETFLTEHRRALLLKALEVTLDGDGPMLMFLLKYLLPR